MKRESWGFSSVPGSGRKLGLEIDAPSSTENERPATSAWGREQTHWERVLNKLALLWSGFAVRGILDPHRLYRAWANDLLYREISRSHACQLSSQSCSGLKQSGPLTTGCV